MLIETGDGARVGLRPVRWEFPPDAGEWDDQWVVVDGEVGVGGRTWSFSEPCLLIGEARDLAGWLHRVADGGEAAGHGDEPTLTFMEPVLGFSVTAHDGDESVVCIHFGAEAAPPWLREDDPHSAQYAVELRLRPDQIRSAAERWARDLDALPSRTFAATEGQGLS